jgi:hypothetical protein
MDGGDCVAGDCVAGAAVVGGRGSTVGLDGAAGESAGDAEPKEAEECAAVDMSAVRAGHDVAAGLHNSVGPAPSVFMSEHFIP